MPVLFVHDEYLNEVPCDCTGDHVIESSCPANEHAAHIGTILRDTGADWLPAAPPKAKPVIAKYWVKG